MSTIRSQLCRAERLLPVVASLAAIGLVGVAAVLATGAEEAGTAASAGAGSLPGDARRGRDQGQELTTAGARRPGPRREDRRPEAAPGEPPARSQDELRDEAESAEAAPDAREAFEETVAEEQGLESFEEALATGAGDDDLTRRDRRFLLRQLEGED